MGSLPSSLVFPFVIEPVDPARVRFWAQYVARTVTRVQFDVVSRVFYCLWQEDMLFERFGYAVRYMEEGDVSWFLVWLDLMVDSCDALLEDDHGWPDAVKGLEQLLGSGVVSDPWYQAASFSCQSFAGLRRQVAEYVAGVCAELQLVFPQYTAAYFAEREQAKEGAV